VFTNEGTDNICPDGQLVVSDLSRTPEAKGEKVSRTGNRLGT
jgi:hypothetical protein